MNKPNIHAPLTAGVIGFAIFVTSVCGAEPTELTNSLGMKLVRIEPGSFRMGQDGPAGGAFVQTIFIGSLLV